MKSIFPDIDKSKLDDFYIKIGQNVKKMRKEKGLSQLELAIMIGQKMYLFLFKSVRTTKIRNTSIWNICS